MDEYIQGQEYLVKPLLEILMAEVETADGNQDFDTLERRMPEIVNIIEMYSELGDYYSQTCADLIELYARIQIGRGDPEGASTTRIVLDAYKMKKKYVKSM